MLQAIALFFISPVSFASPEYLQLIEARIEHNLEAFDKELELATSPGLLKRSKNYQELLTLRHIRENWRRKVPQSKRNKSPATKALKEKSLLNKTLNQEIQSLMPEVHFSEEPTNPVRPSPGTEGNVTGDTFPDRTWAITFDDGPSAKHTLPILSLLEQHGIKATFFWLSENIDGNQQIIDTVRQAGMSMQNHSHTHANLPKTSNSTLESEVVGSTEKQALAFGERPTFFRCPYGSGVNDSRVRNMIANQGMIHVFWNVDSLDWQEKRPARIFARVKRQMELEKKGVVLFHDIHPQTVEATKLTLEYAKKLEGTDQALRWLTLPQVVSELNKIAQP